jgi:chloramphenicol-sensitive protein RarD
MLDCILICVLLIFVSYYRRLKYADNLKNSFEETVAPEKSALKTSKGPLYAVLAYGSWGFVPLYWKAVGAVPAPQMVAHRIVWSLLTVSFFFINKERRQELIAVLTSPRKIAWMFGSALFLSSNWLLFVYAVQQKWLLQVSLGYFINPLVNVVLGAVILKERLNRLQILAFLLASVGVSIYGVGLNSFPYFSIALALTFGLYGLMRKQAPVEPMVGLAVESILLLPLAVGYLIYQYSQGQLVFGQDWQLALLIVCAGPITSFPLLWFAHAARNLPLSTLGFFQYIAPTMQFALAVFLYKEPFSTTHLLAFIFIWTALATYVGNSVYRLKHR